MPLMNGKQYRDSLRKMKHKVYIMGNVSPTCGPPDRHSLAECGGHDARLGF